MSKKQPPKDQDQRLADALKRNLARRKAAKATPKKK